MLKPIWTYGIQLYGTASNSNIEILQTAQSKILRTITGALYYVRNEDLHRDLEIPMMKEEFKQTQQHYLRKLQTNPNQLTRNLLRTSTNGRLRRAELPPSG